MIPYRPVYVADPYAADVARFLLWLIGLLALLGGLLGYALRGLLRRGKK